MRNLKRALSLTLASVMLLGMMVVGSNAAAGYDDVKETDNVEAIEVLQAIEVMVGDERGFGPDRPVNRAEMAVVMGKLLNLDYNYYESACPFTDVSGNYAWARGWVGAAAANGIVSGRGNGIYDPAATVTAVEAASMMMRALGYFKYTEDYADGFQLSTVKQGSEIGIFNGVGSDGNTAMTRNQVAQMALNALQADMVRFTGTPGINVNGVNVGYRAEYTPRTSTDPKYNRLIDNKHSSNIDYSGQYYVQLGEELYNGDLTKRATTDDFERPSFNWQFKSKDIGTYVNYSIREAEYVEAVKYSDLYELLTYTTINENDLDRFLDGVAVTTETKDNFRRSNKDEIGGQGVLTEVFLDRDRKQITITSINTWLAQANSDYNTNNESLSLSVYTNTQGNGGPNKNITTNGKANSVTKVVDSKDVPEAIDVKKDEYKLVYMSGKENATYEVVRMFDTEIMSDVAVTKFSIDGNASGDKVVDKLTTGGTEYKTNDKAFYDYGNVLDEYDAQLLSDMTYNLYMDRYDNVIGVDLHEGAKNYVFITGYDRGQSHISIKTADAAAIFTDGTMDTITVNVTDTNKNIKSATTRTPQDYLEYAEWGTEKPVDNRDGDKNLNRWYTYTVASNGIYTLKPVENFIYTSYPGPLTKANPKTLNSANLFLDDSSVINQNYSWNDFNGNPHSTATKGRIYGEDASIYITVEPGTVDKSASPATKDAITGVLGVYTGAQDVKIDLYNDTKLLVGDDKTQTDAVVNAQETTAESGAYVYSIFDSDNYIIASVLLGEAQGASANYVYVLGGAKNERVEHGSDSRAASDDTYYWEFDAVVDGVETTLTVKEKYDKTLQGNLNEHNIQEVRYDGEYVVDLKNVDLDDIFYYDQNNDPAQNSDNSTKKIEDMKVYDVGNHNDGAWAYDVSTILGNGLNVHNTWLHDDNIVDNNTIRVNGTIYLQGRTLYVDNSTGNHDVGLALAKDAKAVLVQPENAKIETTSCGSVAEAVGRLADRNDQIAGTQFKGRIVAVLDSAGVAQWVVIISDTELRTGNNPNYDYNGKTYTLTLTGCLSNYNLTTTAKRAYVYTRANNSDQWQPVLPTGTGIFSDVYNIVSGHQVRIVDTDITADGQINGFIANDRRDPITVTRTPGRDEVTFTMPNGNVELEENIPYAYTISAFGIDLNQPIKKGDLVLDKIKIHPYYSSRTARASVQEVPGMVLKATSAVGEYKDGKLVATVTWAMPQDDGFNTYTMAPTYTATVVDDLDKSHTTTGLDGTQPLSAQADTTVLNGTVVLTGAVADGKLTINETMTADQIKQAATGDNGFVVLGEDDAVLADGTVATAGETTTVTVEPEADTVTSVEYDGEETAVKDGSAVITPETPEQPDEPVKVTQIVLSGIPESFAADKIPTTAQTVNVALTPDTATGVTATVTWGTASGNSVEGKVTITATAAADITDAVVKLGEKTLTAGDDGKYTVTAAVTTTPSAGDDELTIAPTADTPGSLDVQWYSATAGAALTDAAVKTDIETRLKAYLGSDVQTVTFNGSNSATAVKSDFSTETYTIVPTRVYKVTLDDQFLVYIENDAGATVTVADKDKKYINGTDADSATDALSLTGDNGDEIALASKTADQKLYTAVKIAADGTNLQLNDGTVTIVGEDDRGDKTYTNVNTNIWVKVGAELRIRPADGSGKWSYVMRNDTKVVNDVWDTQYIPDYTYKVAVADADEDMTITFTQVLGTKYTFDGIDLGIIGGERMTAEFATVSGKTYGGAQLVAMGGEKVANVAADTNAGKDVLTVTYVAAGEDGTPAKYTIAFTDKDIVLAADADATTHAVELTQVAKVTVAQDQKLKLTIGEDSFGTTAAIAKWVAKDTEIKVESVGATTEDDSAKVLKALIKELGKDAPAAASKIEAETNVVGENDAQAKATVTIGSTYETVAISFA